MLQMAILVLKRYLICVSCLLWFLTETGSSCCELTTSSFRFVGVNLRTLFCKLMTSRLHGVKTVKENAQEQETPSDKLGKVKE